LNTNERRVRVLHIITRLIVGGAQENTLLTVIGQQQNPGLDVSLMIGVDKGPEGDLMAEARAQSVKLFVEPNLIRSLSPLRDLIATWRIYRFIRRGKFDVVHTHSSKAGIVGRIAAKFAGTPVIVHTLHSLVFHPYQPKTTNAFYIILKRICAPLSDCLISVNDKTRQGAIRANIGKPEQHTVVFSGMKLEPFVETAANLPIAEAKRRLGIDPETLVVGKIARLFPLKGHYEFLESARVIANSVDNVKFLFVGNGVLRDDLEARAAQLGIGDKMIFAGLVHPTRVPEHIQAMDVVIHSSLREGIARVIPQAAAMRKPVVSFDLDGAGEVVTHGVNGFLARPVNTEELAGYVVTLLKDAEMREKFGEVGQQFVLQHFGADKMVYAINQLYAQALIQKERSADFDVHYQVRFPERGTA